MFPRAIPAFLLGALLAACGGGGPSFEDRSAAGWAERLSATDGTERSAAAGELLAGGGEAVPVLAALLGHESTHVRLDAVTVLFWMGEPAAPAVPELARTLSDPGVEVRCRTLDTLRKLGPAAAAAVTHLVRCLERDDSTAVRTAAARALGTVGGHAEAARVALLAALEDDQPRVRARAVEALGRIAAPEPEVVSAVGAGLFDPHSEVVVATTEALARLGKASVPLLVEALGDERPLVRKASAFALGKLGSEAREAIPALEACLDDELFEIGAAAAAALRHIRGEEPR